jgi:hypothetical protein
VFSILSPFLTEYILFHGDDNSRVEYPSEDLVRTDFGVDSDFAVLFASSVARFPFLQALFVILISRR